MPDSRQLIERYGGINKFRHSPEKQVSSQVWPPPHEISVLTPGNRRRNRRDIKSAIQLVSLLVPSPYFLLAKGDICYSRVDEAEAAAADKAKGNEMKGGGGEANKN